MTHRDDEAVADEEQNLTELHALVALDVTGGLEDDEERVAVDLELGPLVRLDRILNGELRQVELSPYRLKLLHRRLVETDQANAPFRPHRS